MQVGRTKEQGLYNKPSAAVHPGALAAGTLLQYNTNNFSNSSLYKILVQEVKYRSQGTIRYTKYMNFKSIF